MAARKRPPWRASTNSSSLSPKRASRRWSAGSVRRRSLKLLLDEFHKHIFELGPPTPPGKPTGRSKYRELVGHHFNEILTSIDMMKDIEFYVGRFPYRNSAIAKHRPPPVPCRGVPERAVHPPREATL